MNVGGERRKTEISTSMAAETNGRIVQGEGRIGGRGEERKEGEETVRRKVPQGVMKSLRLRPKSQ